MAEKPGRNDACYCGSGKKYKKCCLSKDLENEKVELAASNSFSERKLESDPWDNPSEWVSSEDDDIFDEDDLVDVAFKDSKLSDEQNEKLNKWWSEFRLIKGYEAEIIHIRLLFDTLPDLVEYAGLEDDAIFEISAAMLRAGKYAEFIDFLIEFKTKFPEAYKLAAVQYNYLLIVWHISNNNKTEITGLLDAYTIKGSEKFAELIELLQATEYSDILIPFLENNFKKIIESGEYFGSRFLVQPLHDNACSKYLKAGMSDIEIEYTILEFKKIDFEFIDEIYEPEYWHKMEREVFRPFEPWQVTVPKKEKQLSDYLNNITSNYLGFLLANKGLSGNYALYLHNKLNDFLFEYVEQNSKIDKILLNFTKKSIDKVVSTLSINMIWVDLPKVHGLLLTAYYFMEYLELCGNINEANCKKLQSEISAIFSDNYDHFKQTYEEALIFKSIP